MDAALLAQLNAARQRRRAVATLTDLDTGQVSLVAEGDVLPSPLAAKLETAFRSGKAQADDSNGRKIFINVYLPPPRIVVIGAVHISQALAQLAPVAGYDLTIIDPRSAFATGERFQGIEVIAAWPEEALETLPLDAYTALAAFTHDPKIDDWPLSQALTAGCLYVGALGSRKTHARRIERLIALGHDQQAVARIAAPIGLDIGAASPAEIAVATLAQIIQAFRCRPAAPSPTMPLTMSPGGE